MHLLFDFCGQRKKELRTNGGRQAEAGDGGEAEIHSKQNIMNNDVFSWDIWDNCDIQDRQSLSRMSHMSQKSQFVKNY